jgi:uncharacterized protein (TIGR02452 family)
MYPNEMKWRHSVEVTRQKFQQGNTLDTSKYDFVQVNENPLYDRDAELEMVMNGTIEAAQDYRKKYPKSRIAILNFANPDIPGLDVMSNTQEEILLRETNLALSLVDLTPPLEEICRQHHGCSSLYPLKPHEIIYTRNVSTYNIPLTSFDVITSAAVKFPATDKKKYLVKSQRDDMYKRIELIFKVAVANSVEILILGAYGCGIFSCPAIGTAIIFKEMCQRFRRHFKIIVFPIPDNKNYNPFQSILKPTIY